MYVWSHRIVITLLVVFSVLQLGFWVAGEGGSRSMLPTRITYWLVVNYVLLLVWIGVWMFDQARVRGKSLWVWWAPFLIAPLPTLMIFVLVLQRRSR
ncbi:MAG: hypothetical protein OXU40_01805 [Nitrospira sp.]|nr:hypothetical protein [Nitrospira sp.]